MLNMGYGVMKMGCTWWLMTADASQLERAHGCLLTRSKLDFLSPLMSPSWHPVLILHRIFHKCELDICGRLTTAANSFFFHQEEWGLGDLLLNLGRLYACWASRTWQKMLWDFPGSDLNELVASASCVLEHFLGAASYWAGILITLTLPCQSVLLETLVQLSLLSPAFQPSCQGIWYVRAALDPPDFIVYAS